MLVSTLEQSIQLKGYSRFSHFTLKNNHNTTYSNFQVKGHPHDQYVIIPESGTLMPAELKQIKVYLSKTAARRDSLHDSYLQISAWAFTSNHQANSPMQKLRLPIIVNVEMSGFGTATDQMSSQQARGSFVKYDSFNGSNEAKGDPRGRQSSDESSISLRSNHEIDPRGKSSTRSPAKSKYSPKSGPGVSKSHVGIAQTVFSAALSYAESDKKLQSLTRDKEVLIREFNALNTFDPKLKDNNLEFIVACMYVAFWVIVGSYTRMLFIKF